jgi:hypothetical protein
MSTIATVLKAAVTLETERLTQIFDTARPFSYRYELQLRLRLESAANIQTAAGLNVRPWFSDRADLESRGRRERSKKYTTPPIPQRIDLRIRGGKMRLGRRRGSR